MSSDFKPYYIIYSTFFDHYLLYSHIFLVILTKSWHIKLYFYPKFLILRIHANQFSAAAASSPTEKAIAHYRKYKKETLLRNFVEWIPMKNIYIFWYKIPGSKFKERQYPIILSTMSFTKLNFVNARMKWHHISVIFHRTNCGHFPHFCTQNTVI